jgi:hypothetical protein
MWHSFVPLVLLVVNPFSAAAPRLRVPISLRGIRPCLPALWR